MLGSRVGVGSGKGRGRVRLGSGWGLEYDVGSYFDSKVGSWARCWVGSRVESRVEVASQVEVESRHHILVRVSGLGLGVEVRSWVGSWDRVPIQVMVWVESSSIVGSCVGSSGQVTDQCQRLVPDHLSRLVSRLETIFLKSIFYSPAKNERYFLEKKFHSPIIH